LLEGFYLGHLLVEPLAGQVTGPSGRRHLTPKSAELLVQLASRPREVVAREFLLATVWGEGEGSSEALSHTVSSLRHALDDHADAPVFIQTLPRRGYRLLQAPVLREEAANIAAPPPAADADAEDPGWVESLKRRGVIEAAIAYAVAGWLIIQVADIVFDQTRSLGSLSTPWVV
jgi:DNA-binding winged helix-turn-helix (wHTH) protein